MQKWAMEWKPFLLVILFVHLKGNWPRRAHSVPFKLESRQVLETLPISLKVSDIKMDLTALMLLFMLCVSSG